MVLSPSVHPRGSHNLRITIQISENFNFYLKLDLILNLALKIFSTWFFQFMFLVSVGRFRPTLAKMLEWNVTRRPSIWHLTLDCYNCHSLPWYAPANHIALFPCMSSSSKAAFEAAIDGKEWPVHHLSKVCFGIRGGFRVTRNGSSVEPRFCRHICSISFFTDY